MKLYLVGAYNKKSKLNSILKIEATDSLSALFSLAGNLVYGENTTLSREKFLNIAKTINETYKLTDCENLVRGKTTMSIGVNCGYKNPAVIALYNPENDENYLVEFDNTRYTEAVDIFLSNLNTNLKKGDLVKEIVEELMTSYKGNKNLRNTLAILKKKGYILSELQPLKISKM